MQRIQTGSPRDETQKDKQLAETRGSDIRLNKEQPTIGPSPFAPGSAAASSLDRISPLAPA